MYIQLRVMGYHVARLHTDLGGESSEEDLLLNGAGQEIIIAQQQQESLHGPMEERKERSKQ